MSTVHSLEIPGKKYKNEWSRIGGYKNYNMKLKKLLLR